MLLLASSVCGLFKWRQFEPEVTLMPVGWYLRFSAIVAEDSIVSDTHQSRRQDMQAEAPDELQGGEG